MEEGGSCSCDISTTKSSSNDVLSLNSWHIATYALSSLYITMFQQQACVVNETHNQNASSVQCTDYLKDFMVDCISFPEKW